MRPLTRFLDLIYFNSGKGTSHQHFPQPEKVCVGGKSFSIGRSHVFSEIPVWETGWLNYRWMRAKIVATALFLLFMFPSVRLTRVSCVCHTMGSDKTRFERWSISVITTLSPPLGVGHLAVINDFLFGNWGQSLMSSLAICLTISFILWCNNFILEFWLRRGFMFFMALWFTCSIISSYFIAMAFFLALYIIFTF